jgi:hypothetical protein
MNWLMKIGSWFGGRYMRDAVVLAEQALPIVRLVAKLTPTRADDEILRAAHELGVPIAKQWLALEPSERGRALLQIASSALKARVPSAAGRVIDLAVQLAVVRMRDDAGR